ncbi:MAG: GTPase RsgA [Mycoplasma sp.]
MTSYNIKCKGCGAYLNDDPNQAGYIPKFDADKTKLCYRCFRLKHYNELNTPDNLKTAINQTVESIDYSNSVVFMVIDVLNIKHSIIDIPNNYKELILIVNKMDLLPEDSNWQNVCEYIHKILEHYKVRFDEVIFTSTKYKTSMKKINDILIATARYKHFFIGKSNVGKSSIINALLKLNELNPNLSCSPTINTTINLQKIDFGRFYIIDTPGFLSNDNILSYISHKDISKIFNNKVIRPLTYQVKAPKTIKIENFAQINIYPNEDVVGAATFYINSQINVTSCKLQEEPHLSNIQNLNYSEEHLKEMKFKKVPFAFNREKINISIAGLGLLSLKNIDRIEIIIDDKIAIDELPYAII